MSLCSASHQPTHSNVVQGVPVGGSYYGGTYPQPGVDPVVAGGGGFLGGLALGSMFSGPGWGGAWYSQGDDAIVTDAYTTDGGTGLFGGDGGFFGGDGGGFGGDGGGFGGDGGDGGGDG